jgi:hypothetical protein
VRCPCLFLLALGCGHDAVIASSAGESSPPSLVSPAGAPAGSAAGPPGPCASAVTKLGPGLTAEQVALAVTPAAGAPCIDLVRADLAHHRLRVLTAARDGRSQPAPAWRETFHLVAVTNAGMFHSDGDPVALIVEDGTDVSADNKTYQGYLAFDPRAATDPPAVISGRDCPGFALDDLRKRYRSIVQSPRLLGCAGDALPWQDTKRYSSAAIGLDQLGRIVFIHARAAITMSDLSKALAALDLTGALFLEGGPEASLVVRGSDGELSRVGSYETGFVENDANQSFWWLPNILAVEAR